MKNTTTNLQRMFHYSHVLEMMSPQSLYFLLRKDLQTNNCFVKFSNPLGAQWFGRIIEETLASQYFGDRQWKEILSVLEKSKKNKGFTCEKMGFSLNESSVNTLVCVCTGNKCADHYIHLSLRHEAFTGRKGNLLFETKEKYEAIREHNLDPIISLNNKEEILYINRAVLQSFGEGLSNVVGQHITQLLHPSSYQEMQSIISKMKSGDEVDFRECYVKNDNGQYVMVFMRIVPFSVEGQLQEIHLIIRDLTLNIKNNEKMYYLSYHDHLTGLWNRKALKEHLREDTRFAELHQQELTILYLDLDRFKLINDAMGSNCGDDLLKKVGDRLNSLTGSDCRLYRLNADEFVFVLKNTNHKESEKFANQILQELKAPFYFDRQEYFISASIGISVYPTDGKTMDELLRKADQALFYVKDRGRSHYRFFREEMNHSFPNEALMESHLRRAIEKDELTIYYQPQVDLKTGHINSFEALLRWNNRKFGYVSPAQFIPIAEASGIILQIGDWVLECVCAQLKQWQDKGFRHVRIAVNISPKQFKQEVFARKVETMLKKYDLLPNSLEVEITESAMTNIHETLSILNDLKQLGVVISVDDFGTGYSSLSYIKRYPIDIIKIDQSFIKDIESDEKNAAIAKTIIHLAHSLGMEVIAEGVEQSHQVSFLLNANCQKGQGFFFSKPVPVQEINKHYFRK